MSTAIIQYNHTFYFQNSGLPMGSPLSPLLADIFMNHLESKILSDVKSTKHILFWYRYVDDIIVAFQGTDRQLDIFLNFINDIHPNIKFTVEIENQDKALNFLDLTIKHTNSEFLYNIYRKDSFSDSIITFDSFSPESYKYAAFRSLVHRAFSIPMSKYNLDQELKVIRQIGMNNLFPIDIINKIITSRERKFINDQIYPGCIESKSNVYFSLPYVGRLSYDIKKK